MSTGTTQSGVSLPEAGVLGEGLGEGVSVLCGAVDCDCLWVGALVACDDGELWDGVELWEEGVCTGFALAL